MSDRTTRDIWNDDDGERIAAKPRHGLRNLLIFLLVLVAVLGTVMAAAWRDGTGFDALRRYFTYGHASTSGSKIVYHYDVDSSDRFAEVGDGTLVILSDTSLRLLNADGTEIWSANAQMSAPSLEKSGDRVVAYDVGGTALYVLDETGERLSLTSEGSLLSARLNSRGMLAVTEEVSGSKGQVSVYNEAMELVFTFNSRRRFVGDACVTEDGKFLAAVTLGQDESVFISDIVIYDLTQKDPVADYTIRDGLVIAARGQGDSILTVSDTCLTAGDISGQVIGTYPYQDEFLREYDLGGEDFTTLLLNRYRSGTVGRLVTVGTDGKEIASLDISEEVRGLSACGRYLAVLYADRLVVYNRDLQVYSTLHGTDQAREILTRADGSVLMLASDGAELFLP